MIRFRTEIAEDTVPWGDWASEDIGVVKLLAACGEANRTGSWEAKEQASVGRALLLIIPAWEVVGIVTDGGCDMSAVLLNDVVIAAAAAGETLGTHTSTVDRPACAKWLSACVVTTLSRPTTDSLTTSSTSSSSGRRTDYTHCSRSSSRYIHSFSPRRRRCGRRSVV